MIPNLLNAPIWRDPGTWIALGVSLLFIVVGLIMHLVIRKVLRTAPSPDSTDQTAEN